MRKSDKRSYSLICMEDESYKGGYSFVKFFSIELVVVRIRRRFVSNFLEIK